jgi:hypothetical protein
MKPRKAFEDVLEKQAFEEAFARTANNIGRTIIEQMGGVGKLRAMLGAQITLVPRGVQIRWPSRHRSRGNMVEITLQPNDTYDMEFYNVSRKGKKPVKKYNDVYWEQLIELFEDQTGWYLRLASSRSRVARERTAYQYPSEILQSWV